VAYHQEGTILARTSMGKVTLAEAKMLPKLVTGAKGIRKRKKLGGLTKNTGSVFYAGPERKEHQK
jgi:hypothetical protein